MKALISNIKQDLLRVFTLGKFLAIITGSLILSFGLYHIHDQSGITEGGVLGLILLLNHWFGISPAFITLILDGCCYILGYKFFGKDFLKISAVATICLTFWLRVWELLPYRFADLSGRPILAAIAGGLCVGVGVGLIVRQGGSSGGDDVIALAISQITGCRISRAYLVTDLSVLILSLTYISLGRIIYSLITVAISSFVIDIIKDWGERPLLAGLERLPAEIKRMIASVLAARR